MREDFYLVKPSNRYKDSFIEALRDYKADKGFHIISVENAFDISGDNLEPFLQKAEDASKGVGLPEGWVPASQFWIINGEKYVGTVDIRHHLTPLLAEMGGHIAYEIAPAYRGKGYAKIALKLALAKALELGIDKPMVMCEPDNTRSKKCIERVMSEVGGEALSPSKTGALRYLLYANCRQR